MPLPPPLSRVAAWLASACLALAVAACGAPDDADAAPRPPVTIFAAASTTDVLTLLAREFEARTGAAVRCSFAASSTLARQIEAGAPADLFLSADPVWMDRLETLGRLEPASRRDLLANTLVLIAPADRPFSAPMEPGFDFAAAFEGRLALGDPAHVPAGRYARQALERLGWWNAVEDRLLPAMDVRDALHTVALGEAAAGIVYATDAASSDRVVVVATFPESTHDPVRYPIALLREPSDDARAFFAFLTGAEAAPIFEAAGFRFLERAG